MVAPFNQAWMLLKQRGHELALPEPRMAVPFSYGAFKNKKTPQELTDMRADEAHKTNRALELFNETGHNPISNVSSIKDGQNELDSRNLQRDMMEHYLSNAEASQGREDNIEGVQRKLDRQTLARMGQQPEADEMDAMGVPPMSRTLSATPPPNIGLAGSSGLPPVGSDDFDFDDHVQFPKSTRDYARRLNEVGPLSNPFTRKPAIQEDAENRLMNWAEGAGRKAGEENSMPDKVYPEELMEPPIEGFHNSPAPAGESAPTQMDIPNTVTTSPRMSRRNRAGESASYFKKPDREGPIGMSPSQRAMKLLQRNAAN